MSDDPTSEDLVKRIESGGLPEVSMGCHVPAPICSTCGPIAATEPLKVSGKDLVGFSISVAPAPKCDGCQQRMKAAETGLDGQWACYNEVCPEKGVPKWVGGVYPMREVK